MEPYILGAGQYFETTQNFYHRQAQLRYTDLDWSPEVRIAEGRTRRVDFSIVELGATHEFNYGLFDFALKINALNRNADGSVNTQMIGGALDGHVSAAGNEFRFGGGYKSMAEELQTTHSIQGFVRGAYVNASIERPFTPRFSGKFFHESNFLIHFNRRSIIEMQAMYKLVDSRLQVRTGLVSQYLSNSRSQERYWSPREQQTQSARLEIAAPLFGKFSFAAKADYSHVKDITFGEGPAYNVNTKINYGNSDSLNVEVFLENVESRQYNKYWRTQLAYLGLMWPL